MAVIEPLRDDEQRRRVVAQVTRRLIPFAFLCYVIAYIDRVNVGFAAATMQRDLGSPTRSTASAPASSSWVTACSKFRAI